MRAHVIRNLSDMERVLRSRSFLLPGPSIRIAVPDLSEHENTRWETRINRYAGICGCKSSAGLMTAALIGYPAFLYWAPVAITPSGWSGFTLGVTVVFVAGAFGKLLGLGMGRLMIWSTLRSFRAQLTEAQLQSPIVGYCPEFDPSYPTRRGPVQSAAHVSSLPTFEHASEIGLSPP